MARIEENLLILLDSSVQRRDKKWKFIRTIKLASISKLHKVVLCFRRSDLICYLLCSLVAKFSGKNKIVRKVLYINDGLFSCLFSADRTAGYQAFAKRHVSTPGGIRRRILKLLPPVIQAEHLYIAIEQRLDSERLNGNKQLDDPDFMFYSNAAGKLLLTRSETFINGVGQVFKTTSSADYANNLEREYEAVCSVSKNLRQSGSLPEVGIRMRINDRCYYPETYLSGKNLRSVLRNAGHSFSPHEAIHIIERLDNWFNLYHASFQTVKKPLCFLYKHLFLKFYEINGNNSDVAPIVKFAEKSLAEIDSGYEGVVPILAHNDLWPGNFIVKGDHLTAIDWERATPGRAPFFDYFWMIISAVMEYRVGQNGVQDYSVAFRQFLTLDDDVCSQARSKLRLFLESLGFSKKTFPRFILLFLMEWSIQGESALGVPTDMDRLANGELFAFIGDNRGLLYGEGVTGLAATS